MDAIIPYIVGLLGGGGFLVALYFMIDTNAARKQREKDYNAYLAEAEEQNKKAHEDAKIIANMSDDELDKLLSK